MIARVLFWSALLATAAIAFSGGLAASTGVDVAPSASANCITVDGSDCLTPHCTLADLVRETTGIPTHCTM